MIWVGKESVIELQSETVAIEGSFYLNLSFPSKTPYFCYRLEQLNYWAMYEHILTISPLRSTLPIHDVNAHKAYGTSSGGNNTSAPMGKAYTNTIQLRFCGFF